VEETSFKNLILHELRWARTLKRIEPLGYVLTFLTDSLVLSIFTSITLFITTESLILLCLPIIIMLSLRVLLHNSTNRMINSKNVTAIWLIPLRDILSFCIRIISYIGNSVRWRNNIFVVDHLGLMYEKKIISSDDPNTTEKISDLLTP
jgi:ceramide glucosyltransferase